MLIQNLSFDKVKIQKNDESPAWDFLRQYGGYGTQVSVPNRSLFYFNSSNTYDTTSDLGTEYDTFAMVIVMYYAWVDFRLGVSPIGQRSYATYTGLSNVRTAVSNQKTDQVWPLGFGLRNSTISRTFTTTTSISIDDGDTFGANKFFLVGMSGPRYRVFKQQDTNRTAFYPDIQAQGGTPQITLINKMWHSPNESSDPFGNGIPVQLGGTSTDFTEISGYVPAISPRFAFNG